MTTPSIRRIQSINEEQCQSWVRNEGRINPITRARINPNLTSETSMNVVISKNTWDTTMEGKNLAELCADRQLDPSPANAALVVFEIIKGGGASAVYHAINSNDVDLIMQHPMTFRFVKNKRNLFQMVLQAYLYQSFLILMMNQLKFRSCRT